MSQPRPISVAEFPPDTPRQTMELCGPAPQLAWLPIVELVVDPAYQREITKSGRANVRAIAGGFDWRYFSPVIVAPLAGGQYAILDGQHRTTAACIVGHDRVPCQIVQANPNEQARAFTAINGTTTRMHTLSMFKAAIAAGDPKARFIARVARAAGVTILTTPLPELKQAPGQTMAIGSIGQMLELHGQDAVVLGLRAVVETPKNITRGGLNSTIIKGVCGAAGLWLKRGRVPADFIPAIGNLVLIREADKAAMERAPGESAGAALERRLREKLGLIAVRKAA